MNLRPIEQVDTLVIHHTGENWGGYDTALAWQKDRGMDDLAYNSLIENPYPDYRSYMDGNPVPERDGRIVAGRDIKYETAGVYGHNEHTLHIAIVGDKTFSSAQLDSLKREVNAFFDSIPSLKYIKRHCDFDPENKAHCPSLSHEFVQGLIA